MSSAPNVRDLLQQRVGQTLANKWKIDRLIDVGGMAAVFAATHRNGKRVAIKMLLPAFAANEDITARFLREGYVANQVEHAGAVSVLDDDLTPEGQPFLVMDLLEGSPLDSLIERAGGTLPIPDVLAVADQVLDVLGAFHERNVVHRDIKPGNLFVTKQGAIKVLDFGLARLRDAPGAANTAAGVVLGTAAFMPPEQAQGKSAEVDARSDIFAVGAVMYRALTGQPLHSGKSPMEKLINAMKNKAPPVASVAPRVPPWVASIVDRALAFDKQNRWATARDMRNAVRATFSQLRAEADRFRSGKPAMIPTSSQVPAPAITAEQSLALSVVYEEVLEPSVLVDASFGDLKIS